MFPRPSHMPQFLQCPICWCQSEEADLCAPILLKPFLASNLISPRLASYFQALGLWTCARVHSWQKWRWLIKNLLSLCLISFILLSLIAEDVCVWIKTLSPAIWMPSICLSSVESRVISVVSMSTDDSVICGNAWLQHALKETASGKRQLLVHTSVSSLVFRHCFEIILVLCQWHLHEELHCKCFWPFWKRRNGLGMYDFQSVGKIFPQRGFL